jgi:hypothetical protein
MRALGKNGQ